MKKIFLFIFLIAFVFVNAETYKVSTSLSPPSSSVIIKSCATTLMSQMSVAEMPQIDVGLFECDVSYSVSSENCQSVMPDASVSLTANFQVLVNQNSARTSSGKSDCLLQAVSPNCRAVSQDFLQSDVALKLVGKTQAVSPNCRDVLSVS